MERLADHLENALAVMGKPPFEDVDIDDDPPPDSAVPHRLGGCGLLRG